MESLLILSPITPVVPSDGIKPTQQLWLYPNISTKLMTCTGNVMTPSLNNNPCTIHSCTLSCKLLQWELHFLLLSLFLTWYFGINIL